MTAPLKIGHGNGHNRATLVDFVAESGADSFGGNETNRLTPELRQIPGHRVTVAGADFEDRRARSTCVVTRSDRENLGELTRKVSEAIPAVEKFAPDRVLVASFYAHPLATRLGFEGVAHFELHPDATMMKHGPDHPIVREYREALRSTRTHMLAARRDGLLLVLTGDLQADARFRGPWGPRTLITEPLGLRCRIVHIDWIMADRALKFAGFEVRQLFDHRGFVATLTAA